MRRFHIIIGCFGLLLFILSGQYMANIINVPELPDTERLLYRSSHIYLLLCFIANLLLGIHMKPSQKLGRLQIICSLFIMFAAVLQALSFFIEPGTGQLDRPISRISLIMIFSASTALALYEFHLNIRLKQKNKSI